MFRLLLLSLFCVVPLSGQQPAEKNGFVVIEAEQFVTQEKSVKRQWQIIKDGEAALTASGRAYVKALPDTRGVDDGQAPGALAPDRRAAGT